MHYKIPPSIKHLDLYVPGKSKEELTREKNLTHISKLASNENPYGPSPLAIEEMSKALANVYRYPDSQGHALRACLANQCQRKEDNIMLGNGSEAIISHITRTFFQQGDEILTSEDTFIGLYLFAKSIGARLVKTPLTLDYKYDVEALKNKISEKTKALYIANPNNPTGTYLTKDELDDLIDFVPKDCLVIVDEAYFEYAIKKPDYPNSLDYKHDNIITTRTFSKAHGLAGIRIGYCIAHKNTIHYLSRIKLPFEPNSIAQVGALAALKDTKYLEKTLTMNEKLYTQTSSFLIDNNFAPIQTATNFITFVVGSHQSAESIYQELLNKGVIVRPVKGHNNRGFIRLSIGRETEMGHFFNAMKDILPLWTKKFGRPQ